MGQEDKQDGGREQVDDWEAKKNYIRAFEDLHEFDVREILKNERKQHRNHNVYASASASILTASGFLYDEMFLKIAVLGLLYLVWDNTKLIPGKKTGKFAKLINNHPKFYVASMIITALIFIGAGYSIPEIDMVTMLMTALGF